VPFAGAVGASRIARGRVKRALTGYIHSELCRKLFLFMQSHNIFLLFRVEIDSATTVIFSFPFAFFAVKNKKKRQKSMVFG